MPENTLDPAEIVFTVPGTPAGKARHRVARVGNSVRTYNPSENVRRENMIAAFYRGTAIGVPPATGAVRLEVVAVSAMPTSWSEDKKKANNNKARTSRPDADNIAKLVCDGLNGIAWIDDAQVYKLTVAKIWSNRNELRVRIIRLPGVGRDET